MVFKLKVYFDSESIFNEYDVKWFDLYNSFLALEFDDGKILYINNNRIRRFEYNRNDVLNSDVGGE